MPEALDDDTPIARAPDMITADVGETVLILNSGSGNFIELNPAAAKLWHFIETPVSLGALCDTVTSIYDVSREVCRPQLVEWIDEMRSLGLIELED